MTPEELMMRKIKEQDEGPEEEDLPSDLEDEEREKILAKREEVRLQKIYGRFWMWEGYFNEKNKDIWLDTVEMLKNINDHVLQDIEDAILLEGFKSNKGKQQ